MTAGLQQAGHGGGAAPLPRAAGRGRQGRCGRLGQCGLRALNPSQPLINLVDINIKVAAAEIV